MPKKTEASLEWKSRHDAYAGKNGFTYDHHVERASICDINTWHYLKDVQEVEFQSAKGRVSSDEIDSSDVTALETKAAELKGVASYIKRTEKLKALWSPSSDSLLTKLLDKAICLQPLPRGSRVYALRADEMSDDLSWGPGAWRVGLIGARKIGSSLTLDIKLSDVLLKNQETRQQAYGFVAGAVAMQCIPYDREKKRSLSSVVVKPAPNMEYPFVEFDYVLERLQIDQRADIARLRGSSSAMRAARSAIRGVHEAELASLVLKSKGD